MIPTILTALGKTLLIVWAADCITDARALLPQLRQHFADKLSERSRVGVAGFNHASPTTAKGKQDRA